MARKKRDPKKQALIRELLAEYRPESAYDIIYSVKPNKETSKVIDIVSSLL